MINFNDIVNAVDIATALTIIAAVLTLFYYQKEVRSHR
jgi:hypothetical protein